MFITKTYSSSAADTDAIANDVTASSGVAFTLSTDVMPDAVAHKVIITPSGSVTGNYTITGTGADGEAVTETLATNTTNAVTSVNYYLDNLVITAPSGLGANTVDIGFTAAAVTPSIIVKPRARFGYYGIGISVDATGTPAYSLQHNYGPNGAWYAHAVIATKTASEQGSILFPVNAVRLIFTAASVVQLNLCMPE
jgi:hypothetical protein